MSGISDWESKTNDWGYGKKTCLWKNYISKDLDLGNVANSL